MMSDRVKALWFFIFAALSVAVAQAWKPHERLADSRPKLQLQELFPTEFAGWSIDVNQQTQLIAPDAQAVLERIYNQTLSRTYIGPQGKRVMLSVAHGGEQSDANRAHRPEVCYPAQGFQITSSDTVTMKLADHRLKVRRLVATHGARTEPIVYWTTVGDLTAVSGTEQKIAQLAYTTRGIIPDGMLVRASIIDNDVSQGQMVLLQFLQELSSAIGADKRDLVLGSDRI